LEEGVEFEGEKVRGKVMVEKCLMKLRRRKMVGRKRERSSTGAVLALDMLIDSIMVRK